jgi:hypothetical protein
VIGVEPGATEVRPLRVGERVRSTNDEPMFSSDPKAGDVGRVVQTSASSSLVRWADGSESWAARASLEPLQIGDPLSMGLGAGGTPVARSSPTAPPSPGRPRPRYVRVLLAIAPAAWVILTLLPALTRLVRHPTPLKIALGALAVTALIVLVAVSRHRSATKAAAPDPATTGTLDGT